MIVPLHKIKTALLLVDWNGPGREETVRKAGEFFREHGINLFVINPQPGDFTFFGHIRKRACQPGGRKLRRHEDLFISLATDATKAERREKLISPAVFKIGRSAFRRDPYDILFNDQEGKIENQKDIFEAIAENLMKII